MSQMSPVKKSPARRQADHQVSTRAQIERLYGIVAKVQNNEANHLMDLARAYEVNTRTIQRDIEFLRDRLGVPIGFDRKENRYAIEDDFAHIPPLELRETDFLLLSFLQQCLAPYAATEIGAEMNNSFERLFGILTGSRKWEEWSKPILFRSENVPRGNPKELKTFHILQRAITRRKEVTFTYRPLRKPAKPRTVRPLLLMLHKGRWYLYGVIVGKMEITPFSFDRISDIAIKEADFDPSEYPDPREMLRHSFGVAISSDPPFDVVLEFESRVAERVRESLWHPDQNLEELPEGRVRLTLPLNNTMELESWIRGWGLYVRVIQPINLLEIINVGK